MGSCRQVERSLGQNPQPCVVESLAPTHVPFQLRRVAFGRFHQVCTVHFIIQSLTVSRICLYLERGL